MRRKNRVGASVKSASLYLYEENFAWHSRWQVAAFISLVTMSTDSIGFVIVSNVSITVNMAFRLSSPFAGTSQGSYSVRVTGLFIYVGPYDPIGPKALTQFFGSGRSHWKR